MNEILKEKKLYSKITNGEYVADFRKLKTHLNALLKEKNIILESHLLCDLKLEADLVIVLRCNPKELEKRLFKRKYSKTKLKENVLSEILDYCYINALKNYGSKVMQLESTKRIGIAKIKSEIGKFRAGKQASIRWLLGISQKDLEKYF